ncbi:MAG: PD40 domain-containing protein [Planctomycetales bacterium]|nr:PD40 domain-containing protein [Planctomycetales bacterium]
MSSQRYPLASSLMALVILFAGAGLAVSQDMQANQEQPGTAIRMPNNPAVSSDGSKIAFDWVGEIWLAAIDGSGLQRLTHHDAIDSRPLFSPDDRQLAFVSQRSGSPQIYIMNVDGTDLRQVTFHTEGYVLEDWFPDGQAILASGQRDHFHRDANRLIKVSLKSRRADEILTDAMAENGKVSPDGKSILYQREGERWWRKGYQGERSAQIWQLDLESKEHTEILHEGVECMWPLWMSNGRGFYFTKGTQHGFDLWQYRFPRNRVSEKTPQGDVQQPAVPGKQKLLAAFDDDSIVYPAISRDGRTIVFRHLFDLYAYVPGQERPPQRIDLYLNADVQLPDDEMRREYSSAEQVAFTDDGLEIAIIAGGDVWVMDTKLREPMRVTDTSGYEREIVFAPDRQSLWFTSGQEEMVDIWKAERKMPDQFWWRNDEFQLTQVTHDSSVESNLQFTPDGKHLLFQQGNGDLAVLNLESNEKRVIVRGFSDVDYDISSDGRWIAYSQQDNDFNSEVWIAPIAGDAKPVNVSRHPDNDGSPHFSPDGKILAFTGRRYDDEVDIYYVFLQKEFDEQTSRQRRIEEALELMANKRKKPERNNPEASPSAAQETGETKQETSQTAGKEKEDKAKVGLHEDAKQPPQISIDFENIHERVRRISIANSFEGGLLFSPDSEKLLFSASIDGQRGWYTVQFPDKLTPKLLTSTIGSNAVWTKAADGILCAQSGIPTKVDGNGKSESYAFTVAQRTSRAGWLAAGFAQAWLTMRDLWYDERFAGRNWNEVYRKYAGVAEQLHSTDDLAALVELMLGELNGSHLGFYPNSNSRNQVEGWTDVTAHLGVRFQAGYQGPGLLVRDVLRNGPADREDSQLVAGDIVVAIEGVEVDPAYDLTQLLNGRLDRDIHLRVRRTHKPAAEADAGPPQELTVKVRPISYGQARALLYEHWLEHNRRTLDEASQGRLGYLHIRAMDMSSFYEFERELYNVGYGRDGLVIDVRDNGGGSTTDLLLTALTQPRHAITVPRGGGQGYPHDRAVFASWSKPIIVLCNQNSYSNAEIFSHAIKTLRRGKVVGVQTAGGVVSTGSARVNDVGRIRVPFRGWFVLDTGLDMERNGCLPDEVLWPKPGELPAGTDRQLLKAAELLLEEVGEHPAAKELQYAAER